MTDPHGKVEIRLVDNIITTAFIGAFNYEGILDYTNKIQSIVMSLKEKFIMIVDNTRYEGCTPEGFDQLDIFNSWLSQTQLKAKAFIIKSVIHKQIIETRTPSLSLQKACFFSNYQDAHEWLESL